MGKCVPQDLFHRFRSPEPVEGPGGEEAPVAGEGEDPVDHPESVVKVVAGEQDGCPVFRATSRSVWSTSIRFSTSKCAVGSSSNSTSAFLVSPVARHAFWNSPSLKVDMSRLRNSLIPSTSSASSILLDTSSEILPFQSLSL
jgi:hypothetical protein